MVPDTNSSGTQESVGRSSEESRINQPGRTDNLTGVDLTHPPAKIESLPDTDKRFLAGMIREGYAQGLEFCQKRSGQTVTKSNNLRFADHWIAANVPFLSGVIGDVGEGSSSNR